MVHDHEMSWGRRLIATMVMNLIIPAVQIYGGIMSGSMALISDALHNLSDFTSVMISYSALRIGRRGPTPKHTFGYKRLEVFAAVFNVALLFGAGFYIAFEGWTRLLNPRPVNGSFVILIASIAFLANIISTFMLRPGAKINLNMRSAFLHMLTDALTSLGVLILGIIWIFKPWYWLDPVFSWVIVALILYSGWGILKDAYGILMNATPPGIDLQIIQQEIESLEGVKEIHHLHVWNISSEGVALVAHVVVMDQMLSRVEEIAGKIRYLLLNRFAIDHPVLQFETRTCEGTGLFCFSVNNSMQEDKR
ncbi:MAG TPA: cation transporter [Syntrophaceae bacterium]|jgi:cobalt-zinc-cadmium efflux system protein|nr:cation transporter [Syntrophaceae bacterium]